MKKKRSIWKQIFKISDEQSTIYWLIEKQRRWWVQALGFVGFAVLFWLIYRKFEPVVVLFLALYLHEIGHYSVFKKSGIQTILILLFPLGAMAAPATEAENKRSDELPWWNIGWLLLAGPAMNVVLAVAGWILLSFGLVPEFAKQLAEINIILAVLNLLPVWNLDGGQFVKMIFASLDEKHDKIFTTATLIVYVLALLLILVPASGSIVSLLLALWKGLPFILFMFVCVLGGWTKHKKDVATYSESPQAMTGKQVSLQIAVYVVLIGTLFLILSLLY